MNWITLEDEHFNLDRISYFSWHYGMLLLVFGVESGSPIKLLDGDRKKYKLLCKRLEVEP
jgi:hypothetical protein